MDASALQSVIRRLSDEHGTAPGKQAIHEEYARSVFSRPKTAPSAGQLVAPNLPTPPEEHEVADVDWAIRSRGSSVRKPPPLPIASGPIRSIQHQTYTLRCSSAAKLRARTVRLHGEQLINHPDPTVFGRPPKRSAYSGGLYEVLLSVRLEMRGKTCCVPCEIVSNCSRSSDLIRSFH